jgi:hypothetical protein
MENSPAQSSEPDSNGTGNVFRRGVPWSADINRIVEKFPSLPDGLQIPLEEIESCINEPRTKSRFDSVLGAWRKRMEREQNILIKRKKGILIVLDNPGRVHVSKSGYNQGLRKVYVAGKRARSTGEAGLTPEERRIRDHIAVTAANMLCNAATEAKKINYPDPVKQLT